MGNIKLKTFICPECGQEFKSKKMLIYCSRLCANRANARVKSARSKAKYSNDLENKPQDLDAILKSINSKELNVNNYAEYQKQKTLELVGRVIV